MASFGKKSLQKLNSLDPRLQEVLKEAIKHYDFTILEGHRPQAIQDMYYEQGKSKLKYPDGKHNTIPSKAVDLAPWFRSKPHIRWNDTNSFCYFAGFIVGIAASKGIKLRWGGDWDGDKELHDQTFNDLPHFELLED